MTEAEKDLKEIDDKLVEVVDDVAKRFFGRTLTKSLDTHICVSCGEPAVEFRDDKSAVEWRITGLCQKCQDEVFKED